MIVFDRIFSEDKKIINRFRYVISDILNLNEQMQALPDSAFEKKTAEFKARLANNETLDDILVEAFAVAREACRRVTGMHLFPVQILGALILHYADVAEMKTGEGKTITAIMPIYLNALAGKGVHVVTVNEYLADRDAEANGKVFALLGLTCKSNKAQMATHLKREAYAADVTYTTNSELGFDYLRDNMVQTLEDKVQRGLNMAIIDECDSVLIDEARTPLIISGGQKQAPAFYEKVDLFAKSLKQNDYQIDLEAKSITLSNEGEQKAAKFFNTKSFYGVENNELVHYVLNAMKANFLFFNDKEYIVKEDEILLVDQFTGRIMHGRAYSDGLQQAIQAKEKVKIEPETMTMATITYQNFFRLYTKLAGMTGTAKTEQNEFRKIYNMRVVCVPTNRPVIRTDAMDFIFASNKAKYKAIIKEVKLKWEVGQPILLGTGNVNTSEILSKLLTIEKIPHQVLNARQDKTEADIISRAGHMSSVTIATNMAGRGTDIKLSDGVAELGGLVVLGTERHEARRIDNQLRGRSGRQGDPGYSRFYLSLEDELLLRFGSDKLQKSFSNLHDDHMESRMLSKGIASAQKRIEGMNFDVRKNILEYDNILSQHRNVIYAQRDYILMHADLVDKIKRMFMMVAIELINRHTYTEGAVTKINVNKLADEAVNVYISPQDFEKSLFENVDTKTAVKRLYELILNDYLKKREDNPEDVVQMTEQQTILRVLDDQWTRHIDIMTKLKSSIHLRGYAQKNPLQQYIEESDLLFANLKKVIALNTAKMLYAARISQTIAQDLIPTDIATVKVGFR